MWAGVFDPKHTWAAGAERQCVLDRQFHVFHRIFFRRRSSTSSGLFVGGRQTKKIKKVPPVPTGMYGEKFNLESCEDAKYSIRLEEPLELETCILGVRRLDRTGKIIRRKKIHRTNNQQQQQQRTASELFCRQNRYLSHITPSTMLPVRRTGLVEIIVKPRSSMLSDMSTSAYVCTMYCCGIDRSCPAEWHKSRHGGRAEQSERMPLGRFSQISGPFDYFLFSFSQLPVLLFCFRYEYFVVVVVVAL